MDLIELSQNGDIVTEKTDIFTEQEVFPRVGEEFQTKIPELFSKLDYLFYTNNPLETENKNVFPFNFLMGLPIPITWIQNQINRKFEVRIKEEAKSEDESNCLVPGDDFCDSSWGEIEKSSFLLGLYAFGKNFVQVERFVGSKTMGEILPFYYGFFYKSEEYKRWSECRKMRSRRVAFGQKIFTGFRLQELLSRLFLHVSKECQNAILEVSKIYGEGKTSLEDYISSLKSMVGLKTLVDAVAIGRGKQDLTKMSFDPSKSNQIFQIRPEIPSGKACSSLTTSEIIKFLTGDYRLSKARSNDLFWEAVWPRLLARGWHSEQPKDQSYIPVSKHSLVFLVPGVKKFSRRKLVKGDHYFDSITDVLSKVGSEPGLIELGPELNEGNVVEDDSSDEDGEEEERRAYLRPRLGPGQGPVMKFTVVDTSRADGNVLKLRELRMLPIELMGKSMIGIEEFENGSEVSNEESAGVSVSASDEVRAFDGHDSTDLGLKKPNKRKMKKAKKDEKGARALKLNPCSSSSLENQTCCLAENDAFQLNSTISTENNMFQLNSTISVDNDTFQLNSTTSAENDNFQLNSTVSPKSGPIENHYSLKPEPRTLFDLNLPPEIENGAFIIEEADDWTNNKEANSSEKLPNLNSRRQSTRNRPPTARALEALASGFLTVGKKRKNKDEKLTRNSKSRLQKRVRGDSIVEEGEEEEEDCNGDFRVFSEGDLAQISGFQNG